MPFAAKRGYGPRACTKNDPKSPPPGLIRLQSLESPPSQANYRSFTRPLTALRLEFRVDPCVQPRTEPNRQLEHPVIRNQHHHVPC
jgi:hypothetical protein